MNPQRKNDVSDSSLFIVDKAPAHKVAFYGILFLVRKRIPAVSASAGTGWLFVEGD